MLASGTEDVYRNLLDGQAIILFGGALWHQTEVGVVNEKF